MFASPAETKCFGTQRKLWRSWAGSACSSVSQRSACLTWRARPKFSSTLLPPPELPTSVSHGFVVRFRSWVCGLLLDTGTRRTPGPIPVLFYRAADGNAEGCAHTHRHGAQHGHAHPHHTCHVNTQQVLALQSFLIFYWAIYHICTETHTRTQEILLLTSRDYKKACGRKHS